MITAQDEPTVVFVHGLFSSPATWDGIVTILKKRGRTRLLRFGYASPKVSWNPNRSIPDIDVITQKLIAELKRNEPTSGRFVLVGHSFGSIIVQNALLLLKRSDPRLLASIRGVVLIAPPNNGTNFLLKMRSFYRFLQYHPQENVLRPFSRKVSEIQRGIVENFLFNRASGYSTEVRFRIVVGEEDGIVPFESASAHFSDIEIVPGTHSALIKDFRASERVIDVIDECISDARHDSIVLKSTMRVLSIRATDVGDIREVCRIQHQCCHPHERIDEAELQECLRKSRLFLRSYITHCIGMYDGSLLVGFSLLSVDQSGIYVGFVCVDKRRTRLTAWPIYEYIFKFAQEAGNLPVYFEIADPDHTKNPRDAARLRHFLRLGSRIMSGVKYRAPDLSRAHDGYLDFIPHFLMCYFPDGAPNAISGARIHQALKAIVTYFYIDWFLVNPTVDEAQSWTKKLLDGCIDTIPEQSELLKKYVGFVRGRSAVSG